MKRLGIMFLAGLSVLSFSCTKEEVEADPIIQEPEYKFSLSDTGRKRVVFDFNLTSYDDLSMPYPLVKLMDDFRIDYSDRGWLTYRGWGDEDQQQVIIEGCGDMAGQEFDLICSELDRYGSSLHDQHRFILNDHLSKDTLYLTGIRHNSIWVGAFKNKSRKQVGDYTGNIVVANEKVPCTHDQTHTVKVKPIQVVESTPAYFRLQNEYDDNIYLFKKQGNLLFCDQNATIQKWSDPSTYLIESYNGAALVDMETGQVKLNNVRKVRYNPEYDFAINDSEYLRFTERRFSRMSIDKGHDEIVWQQDMYDAPSYVSKFEVVLEDKMFSETYRYSFTLHYWLKNGTKKSYFLKIDMSDGYFSLTEK